MTTIEIEDDVLEYLKKILMADGQEAWYCGGIKLDMEDYNGAIKSLANALYFQKCINDYKLKIEDIPFERTIKSVEK